MKKKNLLMFLLGVAFISVFGFSYTEYLDKYYDASKTSDTRSYAVANGERAIVIQYVGTGSYVVVVSTREITSKPRDVWRFFVDAAADTSVGSSGVIYSSATATDTMQEFVNKLDSDANWVCKLVDARAGENSNLLEALSEQYQANGTALAHNDGYGTCYATNTVVFIDANGDPTTMTRAFTVYYDTGQYGGYTQTDHNPTDNHIRWGMTPSSGKRIVINGITTKENWTSAGTIQIWFDDVLRETIPLQDNTVEYWHTPGVKGQELWCPVDGRVQIKMVGDSAQVSGNYLNVSWYQF